MICNQCQSVCKYKNEIACDHCECKELPITGVCQKCIDGDCKFKEIKNMKG